MNVHITHQELVELAEIYLYKSMKCGVVFKELSTATQERPDAIGFKSYYSILIECKVSRADFLSDKNKCFRRYPEQGMGNFRFYLCPEGIIFPEDLPDKWGLLYYNGKRIKKIISPKGNVWDYTGQNFFFKKNYNAEYQMMYSALRRIKINNCLEVIYNQNYSGKNNI